MNEKCLYCNTFSHSLLTLFLMNDEFLDNICPRCIIETINKLIKYMENNHKNYKHKKRE